MSASSIVLFGVGATALVGIITLISSKMASKSSGTKLLDVFKKDQKQEELQTNIKEVSKEQEVIVKQIELSQTASEETKEKIKKKLQQTAVEIQKTLKEDKISEIDKQIDSDWENL